MKFLIAMLIALLIAAATYKAKALTFGGAATAAGIIFSAYFFGNWFTLAFLIFAYFLVAVIEKIFKKSIEKQTRDINKKANARDAVQVAANGGAAAVCIMLYGLTNQAVFLIGYMVGIGEALADSIASDLGSLSRKNPVNILTFKRMQKGMSGGVSLIGTSAAFFVCFLFGIIYLFYSFDFTGCAAIVFISFFGCVIDSILGVLVQAKYQCTACGCKTEKTLHCNKNTQLVSGIKIIDNCAVNLLSNIVAVVLALIII